MQQNQASVLTGANAVYVAELYARYVQDPGSVDPGWAGFFREMNDDERSVIADLKGASWGRTGGKVIGAADPDAPPAPKADGKGKAAPGTPAPSVEEIRRATRDSLHALMLIRMFRVRGHLQANLDPLGLQKKVKHPELDYRTHGFTDADLDREIYIADFIGESATLRTIIRVLEQTYCGSIGVEFMHIQDPAQKTWIQTRVESVTNQTEFTERGRRPSSNG
jgi:2-oxoglutarate dehydrogenase E1 component